MRARSWKRLSFGAGGHRQGQGSRLAAAESLRELDGFRRRVRSTRKHFVGELDGRRRENLVRQLDRQGSRLRFVTPLGRPKQLAPRLPMGGLDLSRNPQ
jgi:hypothetical protein